MLSEKNINFIKQEQQNNHDFIIYVAENFNMKESRNILKELKFLSKSNIFLDFYADTNQNDVTNYLSLFKTDDYSTYLKMSAMAPKHIKRICNLYTHIKANDDAIYLVDAYGNTERYSLSPLVKVYPKDEFEKIKLYEICKTHDYLKYKEMQNGKIINIYTRFFDEKSTTSFKEDFLKNRPKILQSTLELLDNFDVRALDECGQVLKEGQILAHQKNSFSLGKLM